LAEPAPRLARAAQPPHIMNSDDLKLFAQEKSAGGR